MTKKLSEFGTDGSGNFSLTTATAKLVLPQEADAAEPTLGFGDGDSGIYEVSDDRLGFAVGGVLHFEQLGNQFGGQTAGAPQLLDETSNATNPVIVPYNGAYTSGMGGISGEVSLITGGTEAVNVDAGQDVTVMADATGANNTALLLNVDGTMQRVLVGAADSGGAGYRMLRVANA